MTNPCNEISLGSSKFLTLADNPFRRDTPSMTYPTVFMHRIVEMTKVQQENHARRMMTPNEKISYLEQRVQSLETVVDELLKKIQK